jgi:hypothetical protein
MFIKCLSLMAEHYDARIVLESVRGDRNQLTSARGD